MFGIPSTGVALALVLCLASTLLCVIYAWRNWNCTDEPADPDDVKWLAEESQENTKDR